MKKILVVLLVACMALPLFAQEKKDAAPAMPAPPTALDDDFLKSSVGEWEGTTTMAMGTSQDWQKNELTLDGQFMLTHYTSKLGEMNYKGMGMLTKNPMTGEYVGSWFDNLRGMYKGTGKREGNKVTMHWEGPMGIMRDETMEKIGDDKMVTVFKQKEPDGSMSEGRNEMTRKKMATK